MKGDLLINGMDAWETWGVNMGEDFLNVIDGFAPMKDFIENESRLEHGKRVIYAEPKIASRDLTLSFTIKGKNTYDFRAKRKAFEMELYKGKIEVVIPALGDDIYKLTYLGKSVSYAMNVTRTFCTISAKFEEPNPKDRMINEEEEDDENS